MILRLRVKGKAYSLPIDAAQPHRDKEDENYAEWVVTAADGRVFEVTVWKDGNGVLTDDASVEVYDNEDDRADRMLLDKRTARMSRVG